MSKGSVRRKPQISVEEENLRWELIKPTTTSSRKKQILKQLEKIKQQEINK